MYPELSGRPRRTQNLHVDSRVEHKVADLNSMSESEKDLMDDLNTLYKKKFGFPFVICARINDKKSILKEMELRLRNDEKMEFENAIGEIKKIAKLRLNEKMRQINFKDCEITVSSHL